MKLSNICKSLLITGLTIGFGMSASAAAPTEKADEIISSVKKSVAPDKRQAIFEIVAKPSLKNPDAVMLSGKVMDSKSKTALLEALEKDGVAIESEDIMVFPDNKWGQVRVSAAMFRVKPGHEEEMATQGIMGMPVKILEYDKKSGFYRVQTWDGYISYVIGNSLVEKTPEELERWKESPRLVVTNLYQTRVYNSPKAKGPRDVVSDVVSGCILEKTSAKPVNGRYEVLLPDGRKGWIATSDVTPIEEWASQPYDADLILDQAYSMEGSPYFWGGTSTKMVDCSGLSKVSYLRNGRILMRDASQQAKTGTRIEAKDWKTCQPGDLLFFGNAKTGKVTHVAIYDKDGNYIHSSGRVKRNSVDPKSPDYLTTPFLHAVRINGKENTPGIIWAKDHSWIFKQNYTTELPLNP